MVSNFKDINLKFGVISCLNGMGLYQKEGREICLKCIDRYEDEYSDAPIVEVVDYYTRLEIPQEHLDKIVTFLPMGPRAGACYQYMVKEWTGEDDTFYIKSLKGIESLRNMEVFTDQLKHKKLSDFSPLLKCPKLKRVVLINTVPHKLADDTWVPVLTGMGALEEVINQLREKGVNVIITRDPDELYKRGY